MIEKHLTTIAEVLKDLHPGDDEDSVFKREAAEAHIRALAEPVEAGAGQQCEYIGLFRGRCIKPAGHEGVHLNGEIMTGITAPAPEEPPAGEPRQRQKGGANMRDFPDKQESSVHGADRGQTSAATTEPAERQLDSIRAAAEDIFRLGMNRPPKPSPSPDAVVVDAWMRRISALLATREASKG